MLRALIGLVLLLLVSGISFYLGRVSGHREPAQRVEQTRSAPVVNRTGTRARTQEPVFPEPARIEAKNDPGVTPPTVDLAPSPPLDIQISLPIAGLKPTDILDTFDDPRGGGQRKHDATDIMAPRGTPVKAVDSGVVKKILDNKQGGLTVYQFDSSERYVYYYAHLDRYAPGLKEGVLLNRGELIGYVGSTGNASPNAPHLHFAIFLLGPEKLWYEGTPVNPYTALMRVFQQSSQDL